MAIKRNKYDKVFSDFIRTRAKWTCERCRRNFENNKAGLHCSHYYGRRAITTRYHPDNAQAHCISCHKFVEENPSIHRDLVIEKIGQKSYEALRDVWNNKKGLKKRDIETDETYQQLKTWLAEAEEEFINSGWGNV